MRSHWMLPVDFAGLVPAPVLSIWSGVSVFPLEVKVKEEGGSVNGVIIVNWICSIFFLFT